MIYLFRNLEEGQRSSHVYMHTTLRLMRADGSKKKDDAIPPNFGPQELNNVIRNEGSSSNTNIPEMNCIAHRDLF